MTLVFMFPGQSSRYPGMLDKLAHLHPRAAEVLGLASDTLSRDLRSHYSEDNAAAFERNVDVQLGVFVANHMMLSALQAEGVDAELSLGLSLGEYNHLTHIGALDFVDALRVVKARGEAYDAGPRGQMASVQPLDLAAFRSHAFRIGLQLQFHAAKPRDQGGQIPDADFATRAEVYRLPGFNPVGRRGHESVHGVPDEIHVPRGCKTAEFDGLAREALRDDRRNDGAGGLPRTEGVERPDGQHPMRASRRDEDPPVA